MSDQVYSTGRRKESIAKVWLSSGSGNIIINKKSFEIGRASCRERV